MHDVIGTFLFAEVRLKVLLTDEVVVSNDAVIVAVADVAVPVLSVTIASLFILLVNVGLPRSKYLLY